MNAIIVVRQAPGFMPLVMSALDEEMALRLCTDFVRDNIFDSANIDDTPVPGFLHHLSDSNRSGLCAYSVKIPLAQNDETKRTEWSVNDALTWLADHNGSIKFDIVSREEKSPFMAGMTVMTVKACGARAQAAFAPDLVKDCVTVPVLSDAVRDACNKLAELIEKAASDAVEA